MENFKAGDLVEVTRHVTVPSYGKSGWTASKGTFGVIIKPWQDRDKLYVVHLQAGHKGLIYKNYLKRIKCSK